MRPPPCSNSRRQQCIEASGRQLAMLYIALYTIALGGGGIKSNVSGFGSDQFDISNPKEEKAMIYFFNRFYFSISLGSLFAVTVLVYIQDHVGRGWGYGISAGTMIIAVAILLCGTPLYRFRKPQGSPLTVLWRVIFLAWKKRTLPYPSHPSLLNEYYNTEVPHTERLSDARIFACLSELGVGLTPEPGFHQVDVRGNLFGFLAAHPLSPLLSLHHMEAVEPIFPGMSRIQSLEHLFKAIQVDPAKVLQQTVCYDHTNSLTISIAWGYAVQIYEGNKLLLDILSLQKSFRPWRRGKNVDSSHYMFNTREFPRDPCKRPAVFFMDTVVSDTNQVWTSYTKRDVDSCVRLKAIEKLKVIRVLSPKLDFDIEQLKTPRRHCCDISPSFDEKMVVQIRQCGMDELVTMRT